MKRIETKREAEKSAVDLFHEHLDKCRQCREHPFDLCPEGKKRIVEVAKR